VLQRYGFGYRCSTIKPSATPTACFVCTTYNDRNSLLSAEASSLAARHPTKQRPRRIKGGKGPRAPLAAFTAGITVSRPAAFDPRLQAAFVSGISSQVAGPGTQVWVHSASHKKIALSSRRLKAEKEVEGVDYYLTFMIKGVWGGWLWRKGVWLAGGQYAVDTD